MQTLVSVRSIEVGMVIVEPVTAGRPRKITVRKVEHKACSSRDTHVNDSLCYPWHGFVSVET